MKKIAAKNVPTKLPVSFTAILWLVLDRLDVGDMTWGVFYTVIILVWAVAIHAIHDEEHVDIFEGK